MTNEEFQAQYYSAGGHYSERDAEVLGRELARVKAENFGNCDKFQLLEAATSAHSPLHRFFEWKDATAGHKYRLLQADRILRDIRIVEGPRRAARPAPTVIRAPERTKPATASWQRDPTAERLQAVHERQRKAARAAATTLRNLLIESHYRTAPTLLRALEEFTEELGTSDRTADTPSAVAA